MKKRVSFLLVLVLVGLGSLGQSRSDNPILPRVYEEGYSIEQIREFALGNRKGINPDYARNYRLKLLEIINEGLKISGELDNLNGGELLDETFVDWIYDHVERVYNDSLPEGHRNTWKNGHQVSWTSKPQKKYFGPVDRFVYGVCIIKLDKPSCANLVPDYSLIDRTKKISPKKQAVSDLEEEEKENTLVDYGTEDETKKLQERAKFVADSIATVIANAKKNAIPAKTKTKFLKRKEVRVAGIVIGSVGLLELGRRFLLPLILPKKIKPAKEETFKPVDSLPQE